MKIKMMLNVVGMLAVVAVRAEADSSPAKTLQEWVEAFKTGDVETMLTFYEDSADVVAIESSGKLRRGSAGIKAMYEEAFEEVVVQCAELTELKVREQDETAWASCRMIADSQLKADDKLWRLEVYGSFVLRRSDGRWRIALEHFSKTADAPRARRLEEIGLKEAEEEQIVLREEDARKTCQVVLGRTLTIALEGNPTTGYRWKLGRIEGEPIRALGKPRYVQDEGTKGRVGAGGTFYFPFKAVKPGKCMLTLDYQRPWEENKKPAKTLTFTVVVRPRSED
jgi:inhibitor of cysteine peptidase